MKSRLFGSLFGHCVGDALGLPVEFRSRSSIREDPITGMIGYGTFNQSAGTWSDDTSLMLCTLESLCEGFDLRDLSARLVQWYTQGHWAAHGKVFDIGGTTRIALDLLKRGVVGPEDSGVDREDSNGNGALIRMLPLAWAFAGEPVDILEDYSDRITAITHAHPRAQLASLAFLLLARQLIRGRKPLEAYRRTCSVVRRRFSKHSEIDHFSRFLDGSLEQVDEDQIESTGYCVHSLESATYCLLHTDSFSEAVLSAVNLGGDTDSIGALTGSLAGIVYGAASIPGEWIRALPQNKEIMKLALRFYRAVSARNHPGPASISAESRGEFSA